MVDTDTKETLMKMQADFNDVKDKVTEMHTVLFLNGLLRSTKDTQEKLNIFLEHRGETCPVVLGRIDRNAMDRKGLMVLGVIVAVSASLPAWITFIIGLF